MVNNKDKPKPWLPDELRPDVTPNPSNPIRKEQ